MLYATTRRSIVFGADVGNAETGLKTFAFMRDLERPGMGNQTVIESESAARANQPRSASRWPIWRRDGRPKGDVELHGYRGGGTTGDGNVDIAHSNGFSESIHGPRRIQQTTTATVVVEDCEFDDKTSPRMQPKGGASRSDSVKSLI